MPSLSPVLTSPTLDTAVGKGTWTASGTWTLPAITLGGMVSGGGQQLNNIIIGTTTPLAGTFTTLTATSVLASANDSGALGASGTAFADLFLASGGVINWLASDVTITHASHALTIAGASTGITISGAPTTWSGSISNAAFAQWQYSPTITTSVASEATALYVVPTFSLTNGTPPLANALYLRTIIAAGNANIFSANGIYSSVQTNSGYTNTLTFGGAFFAGNPTIGGTHPIGTWTGFQAAPVSNGNAITSGTVTNYNYYADYATAAAGVGGTVVNYGYWAGVPNSFLASSAGTTNYGIYISGNGGASAGANWALYSDSTASSRLTGSLGIGTTPSTILDLSADAANVVATAHVSSDTGGQRGQFFARKSRNTRASPTIVAADDTVGSFLLSAYDGSAYLNCAEVVVEIDGTPGANDMPTRLVFKTTPDGSATRVEHLRISNDGAAWITSASAVALAVGLTGATNPAFTIDSSTGSQVAGLKVTGAVTGGTVAVVTTDSGSATNLTINAKGTGTIGIGSVSTGAVTITPATTVTGILTPQALVDISGASAGQIKFPATPNPSSNANTLDDYEEAAWSPTITTTGTVGTPAYSVQVGSYEKIGRQVTIRFNITLSGWTGSPTGNVNIGNLPFTSTATTSDNGIANVPNYVVTGLAALNYGVGGIIAPSTNAIILTQFGSTTTSAISAAQVGTTPTLNGSAVYYV